MNKMDKKQKQMAIIGGGLVVLFLLYRWYSSRSASTAAGAGVASPDTSASDFASLAGQEQSDAAALQGQNTQLQNQEQSDVAALTAQEAGDVTALTGQESGDVSNLQTQIWDLVAQAGATATSPEIPSVADVATGTVQTGRAPASPKSGGHYVLVNGAWTLIHAVGRGKWAPGPPPGGPAPTRVTKQKPSTHPSAKNTHVAHPNPAHKPRTQYKPPAPKPAARRPAPVGRRKRTPAPAPRKTKPPPRHRHRGP